MLFLWLITKLVLFRVKVSMDSKFGISNVVQEFGDSSYVTHGKWETSNSQIHAATKIAVAHKFLGVIILGSRPKRSNTKWLRCKLEDINMNPNMSSIYSVLGTNISHSNLSFVHLIPVRLPSIWQDVRTRYDQIVSFLLHACEAVIMVSRVDVHWIHVNHYIVFALLIIIMFRITSPCESFFLHLLKN